MTDDPAVGVSRDGAVAVLTMQRPARYNALTLELKEALLAALTDLSAADDVRALVLTGAGKAFCVGQDLGEHAEALRRDPATAFDTVADHYNPIVRGLTELPFPVVAAINGACVGAGLGFALACDLRVAAAGTSFSTAFTGIGLTADSGLSASLAHAVGVSRALELARRLAAGPTRAYAEVRRAVRYGATAHLDDVLAAEALAQARLATTSDHVQAVAAFLEKRRPAFEGR